MSDVACLYIRIGPLKSCIKSAAWALVGFGIKCCQVLNPGPCLRVPQVDGDQFHKIMSYIKRGREQGATLKAGGSRCFARFASPAFWPTSHRRLYCDMRVLSVSTHTPWIQIRFRFRLVGRIGNKGFYVGECTHRAGCPLLCCACWMHGIATLLCDLISDVRCACVDLQSRQSSPM